MTPLILHSLTKRNAWPKSVEIVGFHMEQFRQELRQGGAKKGHCPSQYIEKSEIKNKHDDSVDSLAQAVEMIRNTSGVVSVVRRQF